PTAQGGQGIGPNGPDPSQPLPPNSVKSCAALRQLPILGTCPTGAQAVELLPADPFIDNPLAMQFRIVRGSDPGYWGNLGSRRLSVLMVRTNEEVMLERVPPYLA